MLRKMIAPVFACGLVAAAVAAPQTGAEKIDTAMNAKIRA